MQKKPDKCLCAFCQLERRVYRKNHISPTNILLCLVASLVVMMGVWQRPDARVLVLFVFFLAMAEIFLQVRWRLTLSCPFCGFDPALYLRDPDRAAAKVKGQLERARQTSALLSIHNPWTHLKPVVNKAGRKPHRENLPSVKAEPGAEPLSSLPTQQI